MSSKNKCWYSNKSSRIDKLYYVNIESRISQWGKPPDEESEILPAGWEHHMSKSGIPFYHNIHTNVSQWNKPSEKDTLPVPKGWEEKRSRNCRNVYYINSKIGVTQWEHPDKIPSRGNFENPKLTFRQAEKDLDKDLDEYLDEEFERFLDIQTEQNETKRAKKRPIGGDYFDTDTSYRTGPSPDASFMTATSADASYRTGPSPDASYKSLPEKYEHWGLPKVRYYGASNAQQRADQIRLENSRIEKLREIEHSKPNKGGLPIPREKLQPLSKKSFEKLKAQNTRSINLYAIPHTEILFSNDDEIKRDWQE